MKLPNDKFECTECENVYGNSHMVALNPKTDEHWCEWCGYEDAGCDHCTCEDCEGEE